jgi:hypothetical protein
MGKATHNKKKHNTALGTTNKQATEGWFRLNGFPASISMRKPTLYENTEQWKSREKVYTVK